MNTAFEESYKKRGEKKLLQTETLIKTKLRRILPNFSLNKTKPTKTLFLIFRLSLNCLLSILL